MRTEVEGLKNSLVRECSAIDSKGFARPVLWTEDQAVQPKRILVPIDFSESSKRALDYAIELAKQFKASLTLVHVVPAKRSPASGEEYLLLEEELRNRGDEQLSRLVRDLLGHKTSASMVVRFGNPAVEIVHAAKELNANLIVISPHNAASHFLRGSVAKTLARHSPCPVLVVRKKDNVLYPGEQQMAGTSQAVCSCTPLVVRTCNGKNE